MIEFNLLPWRLEQLRQQKILLIRQLLIMLLILMMAWSASHFVLKKQIKMLQTNLAKQRSKIHVSSQSPTNHHDAMIKKIFDDDQIILHLSRGWENHAVCLTEVNKNNQALNLTGIADSTVDLTGFLKQWEFIKAYSEITVEDMQHLANLRIQFRLHAKNQNDFREKNES